MTFCLAVNTFWLLEFIQMVCGSSLILAVKAAELSENHQEKIDRVYEGCGSTNKMCYGDQRGCIRSRSCTYVATVLEQPSQFDYVFLDRCSHNYSHALFYAVGAATYNENGQADCHRDLQMTDIKLFVFWKGPKCPGKRDSLSITTTGFEKSKWQSYCYFKQVEVITTEPNTNLGFNLKDFLKRHIIYSQGYGEWKSAHHPYEFADTFDFVAKDSIFYLNNQTLEEEFSKASFTAGHTWIIFVSILTCISVLIIDP